MIRSDRLGLAVLVAMALACSTLSALTADNWLLVGGVIGLTLTAVVGIAGRRLGLAEWTVQLLQLLAGFLFTTGLFAVADLGDDPLLALTTIGSQALEHIQVSAAPMTPNAPVRVLGAILIWLLGWVAEMVVISLARPAWVLPFLLTPYLAGSLAIPNDLDFRSFLLVGLGLFLVLLADGLARTAMLRSSGLGVPGLRRAVLAGGAATVLFGVAGAGVAGVMSGESDAGTWEPFRGQGPIQMADPTLDLRRNLEQLDDVIVIRYQTDQPGGVHLRMTTLPVFDAGGWHLDSMQLFGGALPAAPGLTGSEPQRRTQITIDNFKTQWLPLPYAPTSFEARGDWRHDDLTLAVLSGGDERTSTVGLSYTATSLEIAPDVGDMLSAQVGRPRDGATTTTLPSDLPADVSELAREVTRDALSAGERAMAIQEYLRSDRFRYSIDPAPGSGYDALSRFLFVDRVGYCEQFAASMAVLARAVGIPSRVAIGFLPGSRVGEGWEVSIRDMHALRSREHPRTQ
ncbi:MAG: transglutaminase domain-containing protein [Micropruina sp.]|nr:transglutaminase domain-containing protein [Micropruina sp.]